LRIAHLSVGDVLLGGLRGADEAGRGLRETRLYGDMGDIGFAVKGLSALSIRHVSWSKKPKS
jgi:hypothetical protein